jgi:hypothetical protein
MAAMARLQNPLLPAHVHTRKHVCRTRLSLGRPIIGNTEAATHHRATDQVASDGALAHVMGALIQFRGMGMGTVVALKWR